MISHEELKKRIRKSGDFTGESKLYLEKLLDDAEPVRHGRWSDKMVAYRAPGDIPEHGDFHFGFQCSLCKGYANKTKYCGNCGARMDRGETDEQ